MLGITKLDVVRAKAFIGQITGTDPKQVSIPVVGGHAGTTILPLLSQVGDIHAQIQPASPANEDKLVQVKEQLADHGHGIPREVSIW